MSRPFTVELDLAALRYNVKQIRDIAPQSKILAMVKANAYGHGLISIAKALTDVEGFGVSCSEEALYLRQAGLTQRIVLMEGLFSKDEIPLLTDYALDTVIHDRNQLNLLSEHPLPYPINVWLKINTGMNRLGLSPDDFSAAQFSLKPVMTLKSEIISIHLLDSGDRVGYGGKWIAPKPLRVGIVAIGYGDGYPHRAESGTPILVNDKLCELIGQVSMDMLAVNLSNQQDAKIGDPVVLWGTGLPIEQVAESTSSFRFELLCGINRGQLVRTRIEEINDAK